MEQGKWCPWQMQAMKGKEQKKAIENLAENALENGAAGKKSHKGSEEKDKGKDVDVYV